MFSGQQALITGGTTGIGQAIAVALLDAGCLVTVTGISATEVDRFAASRSHKGLTAVELDVTEEARIAQVVGQFSRLDILVNCAGIILRNGAEHDPVQFARVLDVNLTGTMRMCVACRPRLAEHGGRVVNLASMLSFFGSGFVPAYSASKGGISQLTKSLAIAWAGQNIRVNAIAPGWIATALTQPLIDNPERRDGIIERTPLGRWGRPEDVAGAAVFLCSPAAAFITGVVLPVDGGYSIS